MQNDKERKILRRLELMEAKLSKMETTISFLSTQRLRLRSHVHALRQLFTGQMLPEDDDPDQ